MARFGWVRRAQARKGSGIAIALIGAVLALAPAAEANSVTTVQRTIQDCDGDNLLEFTLGEEHIPYPDSPPSEPADPCQAGSATGAPLRLPPSASIVNLLQLSDFQIVDEESPGRVEWLDATQRVPGLQPFSAAYRPQESLTTQITEAMVRQARNAVSPVTGKPLDLTILTGDNADSQQFNETRWFIDILDGTGTAANPDPEMQSPSSRSADRKIDPNSGVPVPGCEATPGTVYDGVRDSGQSGVAPDGGYYEPDSSSGERDDGDGYSPSREENQEETPGRDVTVRDFPGLFDQANEPFEALGLGMPWYSAFGNHDALVQGNSPEAYAGPFGPGPAPGEASEVSDPAFHAVVTGCAKVLQPAASAISAITPLIEQISELRDGDVSLPDQELIDQLTGEVLGHAYTQLTNPCDPQTDQGCEVEIVPPDQRRCYVAKDEADGSPPGPCSTGGWIGQHFRTSGTPVGHGFAPTPGLPLSKQGPYCDANPADADCLAASYGRPPVADANDDGYYSFSPKPGLRFVVLDTITDECGTPFCSEGSVDDPQFRWLTDQIETAEATAST
jgi:hypothetical protein